MNYTESLINGKIINIHTAFIAKVMSVKADRAMVLPLTYSKKANGNYIEPAMISAYIPKNIKHKETQITYLTNVSYSESGGINTAKETATIIVPDSIVVGDIVFCGVSERDISSENLSGNIAKPTRHHDINDSVILAVL